MRHATGIVRRVDHLGRLMLPFELREQFEIGPHAELEIYVDGDDIVLERHQPRCVFCGRQEELTEFMGKTVCAECAGEIGRLVIGSSTDGAAQEPPGGSLWRTAVHEAGHAVATYKLGMQISYATIRRAGISAGRVELWDAPLVFSLDDRAMVTTQLEWMLAGMEAEKLVLRSYTPLGAYQDVCNAAQLISEAYSGDEIESVIAHCRSHIASQLRIHEAAVRTLAEELIRKATVRGKRAKEIIDAAFWLPRQGKR